MLTMHSAEEELYPRDRCARSRKPTVDSGLLSVCAPARRWADDHAGAEEGCTAMSDQSGSRVRSPDGRWEWDGQAWRPVALPGATPLPGSSAPVPSPEHEYPSPPPIGSG